LDVRGNGQERVALRDKLGSAMIPAGYMAKKVCRRPEWLKTAGVDDILSLSGCISENFADYIDQWKHNGFWLFDSPDIIRTVARAKSASLVGTSLFYYEVHEMEFDGKTWNAFLPDPSFATNVASPNNKHFEGIDVVTFFAKGAPECSPLSCNSLAEKVPTNSHCLLNSFEQAKSLLEAGKFNNSEPGPCRIFAVYSVDW